MKGTEGIVYFKASCCSQSNQITINLKKEKQEEVQGQIIGSVNMSKIYYVQQTFPL